MSTSLYVVASPLQMLYALEARHEFAADKHVLCLLDTGFDYDRAQLDELADKMSWDRVYRLPYPVKGRRIPRVLRQLILALRIRSRFGVVDNLFSGDFNIALNSLAEHRRFFLISDGNKIVWQHRDHGTDFVVAWTRYPRLNDCINTFFPWLKKRTWDIQYFSPFEFEDAGEWMATHHFGWLRSQIDPQRLQSQAHDTVYFLGAYLSEGVWTQYTTEAYFMTAMERIAAHYEKQGKRLIYIPHRHEDQDKLRRLQGRIPTLTFEHFERGVELEFFYREICPTHVASFVSTALYTLPRVYDGCRCDAFQLDPDAFLPTQFWSRIKQIYDYYADYLHVDRELLIDCG